MKIIEQSVLLLTPINGNEILKHIELCGRVCYKSEDLITKDSAKKFVKGLIKKGHESVLEHYSVTVKMITNRGVTHELVRHRIASYSQESTRYCAYNKDKFGNELTFIDEKALKPKTADYVCWTLAMAFIEKIYFQLLKHDVTAQIARSILPNCLKTEIVLTTNLRQWRHLFNVRYKGLTGQPHPQMKEVMGLILKEFKKEIPVIFDDIEMGD
jgi:thymidylate synthase (FAD)